MRRREFIVMAGGELLVKPLATIAQQPALPRIGLLLANDGPARNGIRRSLTERGYINSELADELGLDPLWLRSREALEVLAGIRVPEGAEPIATAHAGHQFGHLCLSLGMAAPYCWER